MENRKSLLEKKGTDEVAVMIPGSEYQSRGSSSRSSVDPTEFKNVQSRAQSSAQGSTRSGPTPSKPRVTPAVHLAAKKFLSSPSMLKRKSRFEEPSWPSDAASVKNNTQFRNSESSPNVGSPYDGTSANAAKGSAEMPNVVQVPPSEAAEVEGDEHVYKAAYLTAQEMAGKKCLIWIQLVAFVCLMGLLIASLTIRKLKILVIWHLELWKWCVLVLAIFCGRLLTDWLINMLVLLIEKEYMLKHKVLYFVYGLKDSVQRFTWLVFILVVWVLLINHGVKRSSETLHLVTRALACCLIGASLWLVKTLSIKLLSASFQCKRFFDRIQQSLFHHYVIKTLSGSPLMEQDDELYGQLSFKKYIKGVSKKLEEVIDVEKLSKIDRDQISAWTMKGLVNVISDSSLGISTLVGSLNQYYDDDEQQNKEITSQSEAIAAADEIFKNVTKKSGHEYIDEKDLLRFMKKVDVDKFIPLVQGGATTGWIDRSSLKNWLVNLTKFDNMLYQDAFCYASLYFGRSITVNECTRSQSCIVVDSFRKLVMISGPTPSECASEVG